MAAKALVKDGDEEKPDAIEDDSTNNNLINGSVNNIIVNGTNDLICAKCFLNGEENGAVGICKDCKHYMCGPCTLEHHNDAEFKKHKYAFFYCDRQLRAKQMARANSFCLDCGHFLCRKCAIDHGGFREYRHHTLIGGRRLEIPDDLDRIDTGLKRSYTFAYGTKSREPLSKGPPRARSISREKTSTSRDSMPTRPPQLKVERRDKKTVNIRESFTEKPRTLIRSTTGNRPLTDKPIVKTVPNQTKRPKTVRYEDQQIAKPARLLGEFDMKARDDKKPCKVVTSLTLPNDKLVVADYGNKKLKLFDTQYKLVSSFVVEKVPVALCLSNVNNSEFYASSGNAILLLDTNTDLKLVQTLNTDVSTVEGLTTWSGGIALIFTGKNSKTDTKRHWEIHLLDYHGNVKYEVAVRPPFSVRLVTPIWYITSCKGGEQIIISDTFNNRIVCVDVIRWHVVYVIKGKESGGVPTSLTTDQNGYIHVTWYGEIHKFSEAGVDLGVSVTNIGKNAAISYSTAKECVAVCPDKEVKRNKLCVFKSE